jgi:hypothetical protein
VLDHHQARIYREARKGAQVDDVLTPNDPSGFRRHMHSRHHYKQVRKGSIDHHGSWVIHALPFLCIQCKMDKMWGEGEGLHLDGLGLRAHARGEVYSANTRWPQQKPAASERAKRNGFDMTPRNTLFLGGSTCR